jgi:hypothetical protein
MDTLAGEKKGLPGDVAAGSIGKSMGDDTSALAY